MKNRAEILEESIAKLPREQLANLPTPLQVLSLSVELTADALLPKIVGTYVILTVIWMWQQTV